jgi:hypothetical protein
LTDAAVAVAGAGPDPSRLPDELAGTFRAVMGWGGMAVWDDSVDIVDLTREYARQTVQECCGQCFPCRIGMHEVGDILEEICEGRGTEERLARVDLAHTSPARLRPRPHRRIRRPRVLEQHYDRFAAAVAARQPSRAARLPPSRRRPPARRRRHPGVRGAAAHRRGRTLGRCRASALPHAGDDRSRLHPPL